MTARSASSSASSAFSASLSSAFERRFRGSDRRPLQGRGDRGDGGAALSGLEEVALRHVRAGAVGGR